MTFTVVYELDGAGWAANIPSVPGCRTWGRSLSAARRYVREALATCIDVLGDDAGRIARKAELIDEIRLPASLGRTLADYRAAKSEADRVAASLQQTLREAALGLTEGRGISLRDAGELLGVSHERVAQVLRRAPRRRAIA